MLLLFYPCYSLFVGIELELMLELICRLCKLIGSYLYYIHNLCCVKLL